MNKYGIEAVKTQKEGFPIILGIFPGTPFGFVWYGGAYIDTITEDSSGTFVIDGKSYRYGDECINVWDYEKDETTIPFTPEAMIAEINEWMDA